MPQQGRRYPFGKTALDPDGKLGLRERNFTWLFFLLRNSKGEILINVHYREETTVRKAVVAIAQALEEVPRLNNWQEHQLEECGENVLLAFGLHKDQVLWRIQDVTEERGEIAKLFVCLLQNIITNEYQALSTISEEV